MCVYFSGLRNKMYLYTIDGNAVDSSKGYAAEVAKLEAGAVVELVCATGPWAERKPYFVKVTAHMNRSDAVEWIHCLRLLCGKDSQ